MTLKASLGSPCDRSRDVLIESNRKFQVSARVASSQTMIIVGHISFNFTMISVANQVKMSSEMKAGRHEKYFKTSLIAIPRMAKISFP